MIQITSTLQVAEGHGADALRLALQHVATSRKEDGCISHNVYLDPEDPNVLFFFERWRDHAAIDEHFRQASSLELVAQMQEWAEGPLGLEFAEINREDKRQLGS